MPIPIRRVLLATALLALPVHLWAGAPGPGAKFVKPATMAGTGAAIDGAAAAGKRLVVAPILPRTAPSDAIAAPAGTRPDVADPRRETDADGGGALQVAVSERRAFERHRAPDRGPAHFARFEPDAPMAARPDARPAIRTHVRGRPAPLRDRPEIAMQVRVAAWTPRTRAAERPISDIPPDVGTAVAGLSQAIAAPDAPARMRTGDATAEGGPRPLPRPVGAGRAQPVGASNGIAGATPLAPPAPLDAPSIRSASVAPVADRPAPARDADMPDRVSAPVRGLATCWTFTQDPDAAIVNLTVAIRLDEVGTPLNGGIRPVRLDDSGPAGRRAFQAARRAILRCTAAGYRLPVDKAGATREIEITFDPTKARPGRGLRR